MAFFLSTNVYTVTSLFRAYRHCVIESLYLESRGLEVSVEILGKAAVRGYNIGEIPVTLKGRSRGKSKFRLSEGMMKHLIFAIYEKPSIFFTVFGVMAFLFGAVYAAARLIGYLQGSIGPSENVVTSTVAMLVIVGLQLISFAFLSAQIKILKRELLRTGKTP